MFVVQSSVAAARRDSLIALYGPFVAAFLLVAVIVMPGNEAVPDVPQPRLDVASESSVPATEQDGATSNLTLPVLKLPVDQDNTPVIRDAVFSGLTDSPGLTTASSAEPGTSRPLPALVVRTSSREQNPFVPLPTLLSGPGEPPTAPRTSHPLAELSGGAGAEPMDQTGLLTVDAGETLPGAAQTDNSQAAGTTAHTERQAPAISWRRLAESLASHHGVQWARQTESNPPDGMDRSRIPRPDTWQRPLLPPVQSIRPLQRAALPPRPVQALIPRQ